MVVIGVVCVITPKRWAIDICWAAAICAAVNGVGRIGSIMPGCIRPRTWAWSVDTAPANGIAPATNTAAMNRNEWNMICLLFNSSQGRDSGKLEESALVKRAPFCDKRSISLVSPKTTKRASQLAPRDATRGTRELHSPATTFQFRGSQGTLEPHTHPT